MTKLDENTIVVGIDGSQCSDRALTWAIGEAERSGRPLLLVTVWHWSADAVGSPMSLFGSTDARTGGRRLLSRSAATVKRHDVAVTTRVMEGSPAAVLAEVSQGAAMLVVGAHGHRGLTRALLGSVSKGCLQKAHCPVVVVPLRSPTAEAVLNPPAVASTGS